MSPEPSHISPDIALERDRYGKRGLMLGVKFSYTWDQVAAALGRVFGRKAAGPSPSPLPSLPSLPGSPVRRWHGDGSWPFVAVQDGADVLLVPKEGEKLYVTWFGGDSDPMDSGETASGVLTKGNPTVRGCALPMNYTPACAGSPLPKLPWTRTKVAVTANGRTETVPLIDVGPNRRTWNSLDLTLAVFSRFYPTTRGRFVADEIRIIGGVALMGPPN